MPRRIMPSLLCPIVILFALSAETTYGQRRAQPKARTKQSKPTPQAASVADLTSQLEQLTNGLDVAMRLSFRLRAADSLQGAYPELARKFIDLSLAEIGKSNNVALDSASFRALAKLAPADAVAALPHLPPNAAQSLLGSLAFVHQTDAAVALYRDLLAHGNLALSPAKSLMRLLTTERPDEAVKLYQEITAKFPFESADPITAWQMLDITQEMHSLASSQAVDVYERIINLATPTDFGKSAGRVVTIELRTGLAINETADSRDTLLVLSGLGLYALAPDRFEKLKPVFGRRDLTKPISVESTKFRAAGPRRLPPNLSDPALIAIHKQIYLIHTGQKGADRSQLVGETARAIQALPADDPNKMDLALMLAKLCQGSDLEKPVVAGVAAMLTEALKQKAASADTYLEVASSIMYESAPSPERMPPLVAAVALLELRDRVNQQAGFTLKGLDGKEYSLAALHGKVVLLNFWATWCGPCRAEFPAIEKLYREFDKQGFVVLAVSDEDRPTVDAFIQKQPYTFTFLLDAQRKVNSAFDIVALPQSFIFDREGRLVAKATAERTEQQFRELLKKAGLE